MANELSNLMREVLASPLGDVIASVGRGVAEAQEALDEASLAKTLDIYSEGGSELLALMREIGYQPTFYALPETTGEVVVSMRLGNQENSGTSASAATSSPSRGTVLNKTILAANIPSALAGRRVMLVRNYVTPVDASFANRFGYSAQASTRLTFKIVPVPPPEGMDRVRVMPDFAGKDAANATLIAQMLNLNPLYFDKNGKAVPEPKGDEKIARAVPEAGSITAAGSDISLFFE